MTSRFARALAWFRASPVRVVPSRDGQATLRAFLASGDPLELPGLLPLMLAPDAALAEAASRAIDDFFRRLSARERVALDDTLRRAFRWSTGLPSPWLAVAESDVPRLRVRRGHPAAVLGLASSHPNGSVREAAVRQLAEVRDGGELPFLLIRLNDWVDPIQSAAYRAVRERLVPAYAPFLVRWLWLVARLERGARTGHAALVEETRSLLRGPAWHSALLGGVDEPDRWLRRTCYGLLLDTPGEDTPAIIGRALRDEDAVIRLRAARQADTMLPPDAVKALLPAMQRDPVMPVRREALGILVRRFPEAAEPGLRSALLDCHATLREVARHDLRQRGITDFRDIYRSAVESGALAEVRVALHGLGETGTGADAAAVARYLAHPAPTLRQAAVTALARLAPEASIPSFVRALEDPSARVSKAARRALASHLNGLGGERIWEAFNRATETHVRGNALSLLAGLGKWEGIGWIIRACGCGDAMAARLARQHALRWTERFNRTQAKPSAEQLRRMARALDDTASALGANLERMLRFLMKGF